MGKRQVQRLSVKTVQGKLLPGFHPDGMGLYLQVGPELTKSWVFRYKRAGREHWMGLGSTTIFTLAEARQRAQDARKLLADGIDPLSERKASRAAAVLQRAKSQTFDDCAAAYIKAHRSAWRNPKHGEQWENTIATYVSPVLGRLAVADVDTALILRVLEPLWTEKNETATRLRGRIERIIDWATTRGYRTGENPARWRGHLQHNLPALKKSDLVEHHAALPFAKVPAFVADLKRLGSNVAKALEFTILTAARTGEVIKAVPAEFDLDSAVWTVPAARMKGKREHRVPLSPRAVAIARGLIETGNTHVFPGRQPSSALSNMAMLELVRRTDHSGITVHGFRSSFRDWAAERTSYPREVCEMALAHVIGDAVEAAYRRGDLFDKRRRLMAEWARFCEQGKGAGEVVPIRKKSSTVA